MPDSISLSTNLSQVKREDVLDDTGRQRPILIQSNESTLLEKLQVNEFLYEAQQNKNPVPSLVEKLAQLLELLHSSQGHCDQYLSDLAKSNSLVSALRQKNMVLFEKTSMFESFKTRALIRYMMNLFESNEMQNLYLDGLYFTTREIAELINLTARYNAEAKISYISLAQNGLKDDSINVVLQVSITFKMIWLKLSNSLMTLYRLLHFSVLIRLGVHPCERLISLSHNLVRLLYHPSRSPS